MKHLQKFLFLTCVILLSGCAGLIKVDFRHIPEDFEGFNRNEKGIILFTILQNIDLGFLSKDMKIFPISYTLRKVSDEGKVPEIVYTFHPSCLKSEVNYYARDMLFLEPGLYYIDGIRPGLGGGWYFPSPGYKNGKIMYSAFEVKAGQVISLGSIDSSNGILKFIREDEKIKRELNAEGYGELAASMKPGIFYAGGSIIKFHKNGQFNILPKTVIDKLIQAARQNALAKAKLSLKSEK
ncbi:hypothetical protein H1Q59_00380 [Holosporaceae bacterium 'Namur']|nr:hypothetical protein [Holosporaceae bacterium 'Namur']